MPPSTDERRPRATLATCGAAHVLHDGFSNLLYLLLPVWAEEFQLSLTQVGLLKAAYSGAMSSLQLPAAVLAERWGERNLLGLGTLCLGAGYLTLGLAGGFLGLLFLLIFAGFGSCVQHPLSSALVAHAFAAGRRRAALGIYNFTGDVGKVAVPGLVGLILVVMTWRDVTMAAGLLAMVSAISIFLLLGRLGEGRRPARRDEDVGGGWRDWGIRDRGGFWALSAIGVLDSSTRGAVLTFVPFLLTAQGASVQEVALALTLIFAGGACGKFACGMVAEKFGIVRTTILTELMTSAGIAVLLVLPLEAAFFFLPVLGVALNGTSSVLYGTVAELVDPQRHARAFGLFYTFVTGSSAAAPAIYGFIGDRIGIPMTLSVVAVILLASVPLAARLRV